MHNRLIGHRFGGGGNLGSYLVLVRLSFLLLSKTWENEKAECNGYTDLLDAPLVSLEVA
jgi:hypothetical protein